MSSSGGVMYGMSDGLLFMWGNIHVALEVKVAIGHMPIVYRGMGKQRGSHLQTFQGSKY